MFSEHDLPLTGSPCSKTLCLRGAMGVAPTLDGDSSGWMQVGMSSNVNPEAFIRPALTLVLVVDVSSSMGWDYADYGKPSEVAKALMTALVPNFTARDRVAMVTFDSNARTVMDFTPGDRYGAFQTVIDSLRDGSSTNMEGGLELGIDIARSSEINSGQVRIMIITDAHANVGSTDPTSFGEIAKGAAEDGIGITVFGTGVGLRQELVNAMVNLRGGNAFSLFVPEDVDTFMDDHWPWMVSPIAYDLNVQINPCSGFDVADTYGFPGEEAGLDVATVFLSKKKGALLLRLTPADQIPLAALCADSTLAYTTPAGDTITEELNLLYPSVAPDDRGMAFDQHSVGKTVALAVLVSNMEAAAEIYGQDPGGAVEIMQKVFDRITKDAQALADPALDPEVQLAEDLLSLMEAGAEQGDLYGQR
jgi:Ca-activated chloride channel family protein